MMEVQLEGTKAGQERPNRLRDDSYRLAAKCDPTNLFGVNTSCGR